METKGRSRPASVAGQSSAASQRKVDADDRTKTKKPNGAMQAGARKYPEPPSPGSTM